MTALKKIFFKSEDLTKGIGESDARHYVERKELEWGYDDISIRSCHKVDDGSVIVWRVVTNNNTWDVWDALGVGIYGEC